MSVGNEVNGRLFIAGEWVDGYRTEANRSPSDLSDIIGHYAWASVAQAEQALASAHAARKKWARSNPQLRTDILRRTANAMYERADKLASILAREEGKTLKDAKGEVLRAAQVFQYYSGEPTRNRGEFLPGLRDGFSIIVEREPLGVVSLITPWNFPIVVPAWKIASAIAYANTIVFKPSEVTPGCAVALVEILLEAGLPPDVLNLVNGSGAELGDTLIAGADGVSFTGSTGVGRHILQQAAKTMTKVQLELGGKSPLVVLDDANLEQAVQVAFDGAVPQTGQRCTCSSRLIVTRKIHDQFVERLAAKVAAVRVGHAMDADTDIGPVATEAQLAKDLEYVAAGVAEGAQLMCGGERLQRRTEGYYLSPALFAGTHNNMRVNREEIFGPIASIIQVDDLDEAIAVATDTEFGLSSAICTRDITAAEKFRRESNAGMVIVNAPTSGAEYHVPFAGRGLSGYGAPEQGTATADFFTEAKTAYINHGVV